MTTSKSHTLLCWYQCARSEMNYWPTNNGSYLRCLPPRHQPSDPSARPDTCWFSPVSSVLAEASSPETVSRCHKRSLHKVNTIWCTTELQNHTNFYSKLNTASCKLRPFWTRHRPRLERLYMSQLWSPPQNGWLLSEISFLGFIRVFLHVLDTTVCAYIT
jgi:hypothetical protein